MGVRESIAGIHQKIEAGIQTSALGISQGVLRVSTSVFLALITTEVLQDSFSFGVLSYVFLLLVTGSVFMGFFRNWDLKRLAVFDIIVILTAIILQTYVGTGA